jgi:glycosyltransferase involved in cell wall biosynthesis
MHILLIHQYYCPPNGWGNNRSAEFVRYWLQAGCQVTLLTTTAYFPPDHTAHTSAYSVWDLDGAQVHVLRVPYAQEMGYASRIWAFVRFLGQAKCLIRKLPKPDVIYACSTPPTVGQLGKWAARRWGIPWVFECIDVWPEVPIGMGIIRNPVLKWVLQKWLSSLYRSASQVVTLSEGMAEMIATYPTAAGKVQVLHNGTNCATFRPLLPADAPEADAPFRVVYAGAVGRVNGLADALTNLAIAAASQPRLVHLDVFGWGDRLPEAQQVCRQLPPQLVVQFHPPLPKTELATILPTYDLGLMTVAPYPVLNHNSANKYFDYLAAGVPVLLNYAGWQAEYLQGTPTTGPAGFWAPMGDTAAFKQAFLQALELPHTTLATYRHNARALACAYFDRAALSKKALLLMQELTERPPKKQ